MLSNCSYIIEVSYISFKHKVIVIEGSRMNIISMLLAILAGVLTTIEATINSQLGKYVTPSIATLHSLMTGLTFVLLINLAVGNLPRYTRVTSVRPVWLIGGFFGASIIYLTSRSIPSLGISNALILIVAGQLTSSLIMDVFLNNSEVSLKKMGGMILFLVGTIMFLRE